MLTTATKSLCDNSTVWLGWSYEGKVSQWATQVRNHISRVKTLTINEKPSIRVWWRCDDISPLSSVTFPRNILNNLRYLEQVTISSSEDIRHNFHNFHQSHEKTNHHTRPVGLTPRIKSLLCPFKFMSHHFKQAVWGRYILLWISRIFTKYIINIST